MCVVLTVHARQLTAHARPTQAENNNAAGWRVEVSTGRGGGGGGRGGGGGGGRSGPPPPFGGGGGYDRGRDERPAERYGSGGGGGGGGGYDRGRDERCAQRCQAR
jgi:hypothetical protein